MNIEYFKAKYGDLSTNYKIGNLWYSVISPRLMQMVTQKAEVIRNLVEIEYKYRWGMKMERVELIMTGHEVRSKEMAEFLDLLKEPKLGIWKVVNIKSY